MTGKIDMIFVFVLRRKSMAGNRPYVNNHTNSILLEIVIGAKGKDRAL